MKIVGEGRGRLSFKQQQYLFSFDAVLKENKDWIFAAIIPLHGEEVLVLRSLDQTQIAQKSARSLEARIEQELALESKDEMAESFMQDLRSLNSFLLASELGHQRICHESSPEVYQCTFKESQFQLFVTDKDIRVKKITRSPYVLEVHAQNLTDSFFTKTSYHFYSREIGPELGSHLDLELFWK